MTDINITIIGAGVIGLAIAWELSRKYENIVIVERHNSFGQETSSRNSEVIHSGIHYPPGSLKANLCVEGRGMLYDICKNNGVGHERVGKLLVATSEEEIDLLETLKKQGEENGVEGLLFYEPADIKRIEPAVNAKLAIYSPDSGIIDSHNLMSYFAHVAESRDALIVYNSEVIDIARKNYGFEFKVKGLDKTIDKFTTKILINSAGLCSDKIAGMCGIDIDEAGYRLHLCKGEYFSWNKKILNHLIYPVPHKFSLGIHAGLDLNHDIKFGPNAYFVDEIDYQVNTEKEKFYNSIKKYLPVIKLDELSPAMSGIRPKLQTEEEDFRDFIICPESERDLPGLINLIGIESPGLTAAPALALYVAKMIDSIYSNL
ncbi:NAD(P)/FAD-dependent oxidoreductase [Candidatus Aerophobetes bacterium]|nr:NAD(P)/FAD-dependent oxidoreductase [Candidatus Aerophobetes bacterium]